jgi:hypothetical protein
VVLLDHRVEELGKDAVGVGVGGVDAEARVQVGDT